jgi:predicted metalloprotease with PDZ domain
MVLGIDTLGENLPRRSGRALKSRLAVALLWLCGIIGLATTLPGLLKRGVQQEEPLVQPERASIVAYSLWVRTDLTPPRILVRMQIPVARSETSVSVQMPVWSPGDYHIQNHARFVGDLHAVGLTGSKQNAELVAHQTDPNTWRIEPRGSPNILVTYAVPQTPPGIFSDNVTLAPHYAFVNGPSALAYVVGHKDWKTNLYVYLPANWSAETALPTLQGADGGASLAFSAPDYDTLADSPLVAADARGMIVRQFEVDHVPHRAVFFHDPPTAASVDAFIPILRQVTQAENDIMGGPPYARYDFLFDVGGEGGGLEHLNSARLLMWPGENPRNFKSFVAHEFFHLWNVKRIRPAVLGPFDYVHPPKTRNLWFAEGVTEYYAHIAVRRAGLADDTEFLHHWQSAIARMQGNPARKRISADEASLRVWESGDSQGYGGMSYYDKGELIGLCLDLKIRHVTNNAKSLDDVMRLLLQRHNPPKPGYGEDEIRSTVSEIAGQDLSAFYDLLARSTEEMPFAECLGYAGLDIALRPLPNASAAELALREKWSSATAALPAPKSNAR